MKKKFITFLLGMSFLSTAMASQLTEGMSYHIRQEYPGNKFSYAISLPGADAWLADGDYHAAGAMPACLNIMSSDLSKEALRSFARGLIVTGSRAEQLPLREYKGTLHFVDMSPFGSSYADSIYTVETKDGYNFADLLTNVGGTSESTIYIQFDRGCKELATRPYLPSTK